jgi:ribosome-binding factor A
VASQRTERVSGEVRAVIGEILSRDEIKDPRVRGAGLITVTHVRVTGDLRHAKAMFTVHGLDAAGLERVRSGLDHASGYFRQAVSRRLRTKVAPEITFEIDLVFDKAMRIESLLHEIGKSAPAAAPAPDTAEATGAAGSRDDVGSPDKNDE